MKKIYVLLFALAITTFGFGQTLATINRANVAGTTDTNTITNITANGVSRSGLTQDTSTDFSSKGWETSTTLNTSQYLQWSVKGNTGYNLILTGLDIRYRRLNNQAPKTISIYYSYDAFATSTLLISTDCASNDHAQKTLSPSLTGVAVGSGGTITFRLYGYNAANANGQFNIEGNTAWAIPSTTVTNPGIRIRGSVSTGGLAYTGGAWSPFAPNTSTGNNIATVMDGTYTPTANISLSSLTVNPEGNVSIPAGITLTCPTSLFESNSTRYSSLILNGTLIGTVNYNRHVNGGPGVGVGSGGNDLISAPVTGQNFISFTIANPNLRFNTAPDLSTQKVFGPFNKSTGTYLMWDITANGGEILTAGVGYRAATTNNLGLTFTGAPNNAVVTHSIVNSGPQFAAYNLIGNPYPSYMNVREFLEFDVEPGSEVVRNMDLITNLGAIYGYDGDASGIGSDGWNVYNLTTSTTVNIAPGQGFLVTAKASQVDAYDMTFTPSMRRIGNTDDFIPGRMASENNVHIKLQASIGTSTFNTKIYFNDNSSSGLDYGYDAAVFGSNAASKSIYTHLVENNTGVDLAIQSLAYSALGSDIIVPLGINVSQGQQVTVSITECDLPSNIEVYLEDNVTGTFTSLNTSDYVFTATNNLNDTGRFFLRFSDASLSTPNSSITGLQIFATASPRALFVKGQLQYVTKVSVYDIQGRRVVSNNLEANSNSNQIDISNLSPGVYVVKLNNASQQKTQKVILK